MEPRFPLVALGAALGLAVIHLLAGKMRFLEGIPRSRWLSGAGGVSVAYVFLHLLPELAAAQRHLSEAAGEVLGVLERHVYLMAMTGLAVFYGLDRMAHLSRRDRRSDAGEDRTSQEIFWIHIVSFALYNVLIGYLLLHREEQALRSLLLFSGAMALHFVVNDFALWEHHKEKYRRQGRWLLAAAVVAGWAVGYVTEVSEAVVSLLLAFLAGGVVLNVLKEEVPEQQQSRFWAFALGMAGYGGLLLML